MKKVLVILILLLTQIYPQFIIQPTPVTGYYFEDMHFLNGNFGFVVGDSNKILKTTDGGLNWVSLYNNLSSSTFSSVFFLNYSTGFVCAFDGEVLRTTNSGNNWIIIYSTQPLSAAQIFFTSGNTGYISGYNYSYFHKTTNAGQNWISFQTSIHYVPMFFVDDTIGYAGGIGSNIYKTFNGGNNWFSIFLINYFRMADLKFIGENTGYSLIFDNSWPIQILRLYKTTNAGLNWNPIFQFPNSFSLFGSRFYFTNSLTGYIISGFEGGVFKTTTGGTEWNNITNLDPSYCIYFPSQDTGYVAGRNIYKTTNGGVSGIIKLNENILKSFSLSQNYPNPFNPTTKIRFNIPSLVRWGVGVVVLKIYDLLGREVATLVNEQLKPGTYEVEWNGSAYASGVYFYSLMTSDFTQTKKLILLK